MKAFQSVLSEAVTKQGGDQSEGEGCDNPSSANVQGSKSSEDEGREIHHSAASGK